MGVLNTPSMNLPVPGTGQEAGPQYAIDINSCMVIIDGHNHTSGYGVQVPSAGLNINTDLTFQSNNATTLRSSRYTAQNSPLSLATDIGCVYVSGVDLYYNDTNGNQIQLTAGGTVNATSSGISSGTASAAFSAGVLVVKSTSTSGANVKMQSAVLTNNANLTNTLTLQAPTLSSSLIETLPAIPGATGFMTMDTSGNMAATIATANGITRSNLAAVGQQISSSCGGFTTTATSATAITNLSVTITTTGRPVMIMLQPDGTSNKAILGYSDASHSNGAADISIFRGVSAISQQTIECFVNNGGTIGTFYVPPGVIMYLDTPSAGTYTYAAYINRNAGTASTCTATCSNCVLAVYEL